MVLHVEDFKHCEKLFVIHIILNFDSLKHIRIEFFFKSSIYYIEHESRPW